MLGALGLVAGLLNPGAVEVSLPPRADCPQAERVAEDIEALVGDGAPAISVDIVLTDTSEGVVANVRYRSGGAQRVRIIPGPTCADVVGAAAVVVAVGVDPIAVQQVVLQRPARPMPRPPEPMELPELPELPATPADEPAPSSESSSFAGQEQKQEQTQHRPPFALGVFARGGVAVGGLPRPGGWLGGGLGVAVNAFGVELSGQHAFARRVRHPAQRASGAHVSLTSGRAGLCWIPRIGAFSLGGCASADLGTVRAAGFGLAQRDTPAALWAAVTPGLRAFGWPSRRVRLGVVVDVPISMTRPRFSIDDFEAPLAQVDQVAVWAGLSVGFVFFDETRANRR
mgnify:CR=1 FL=1